MGLHRCWTYMTLDPPAASVKHLGQQASTGLLVSFVVLMCGLVVVTYWSRPLDLHQIVPMHTGSRVDLNTADVGTLALLPGIGPGLGRRIIEYREHHGGLTRVEQLQKVSGIGPVRLSRVSPFVICGRSTGKAKSHLPIKNQ